MRSPGNTGGGEEGGERTMSAKAKRILAKLNDPRHRNRLLESMNKDTAPEGLPVSGGNQEMTILKNMESLDRKHDQYMQDLKSGAHSG